MNRIRSIRTTIDTRRKASGDEQGAVLILALIFLVVIGLLTAGLTGWAANSLANSQTYAGAQSLNNDATNAVDLAIQNIRYAPLLYTTTPGTPPTVVDQTLNASPPTNCWGTGPSSYTSPAHVDGRTNVINLYCSTVWNPTSQNTRKVTISACLQAYNQSVTACAAKPLLQAIVTIDDYPPGVSAPNPNPCVEYCGNSLSINSWVWSPTIPQITSVTGLQTPPTPSGSSVGGQALTITGTGFTSGSTVNFVDTNPLASATAPSSAPIQQIVPAKIVCAVTSPCASNTIQVLAPAVTAPASYFITVTTPGGTSPTNASFEFQYSTPTPTLTAAITPNNGFQLHETVVTITGTGFVNGATVNFVPESGGVPTGGASTPAATVQIMSPTQIQAKSPPISTTGTYFVTVTTSAGSTPYGTTSNDVFTYTTAPA